MESDEWQLSLKEQREEIELEIKDRLSFLSGEKKNLDKVARTGWWVAIILLLGGFAMMSYAHYAVGAGLSILSVWAFVASKFDEARTEIIQARWEQAFFLERMIRNNFAGVGSLLERLLRERRA